MPFGRTTKEKAVSKGVYENIIVPSIKAGLGEGAKCYRIDTENVQGPVKDETMKRLKAADVVVADVSDNNPNVSFELGYRLAQRKPFVLISDGSTEPVYWLRTYQIINYTKDNEKFRLPVKIGEAYAEVKDRVASEEGLAELESLIRGGEKFKNPFQDRLIAWRIERAKDQAENIQKRDWEVVANDKPAYIALMFEGIIGLLEKEEEYWTVTNLKFWSDTGVGGTGFLRANLLAAERGVNIERIFRIEKREWRTKRAEWIKVLNKHSRIYKEVKKDWPGKITAKCLMVDNNRATANRFRHFALARHLVPKSVEGGTPNAIGGGKTDLRDDEEQVEPREDDGGFLILPHHSEEGMITSLRVIFSKRPVHHDRSMMDYADHFREKFAEAEDLATFLQNH